MHEGVIKFRCVWRKARAPPMRVLQTAITLRQRLHKLGFIAPDRQGIGHGNVSVRGSGGFYITGTGTGVLDCITNQQFTKVTRVDVAKNRVACTGPVQASSESMTHYAVYAAYPSAKAVIHVHAPKAWKRWVGKLPTTSRNAQYGTPEIARATLKLFAETEVTMHKAFVLGGHRPGLIVFGKSIAEAERVLRRYV